MQSAFWLLLRIHLLPCILATVPRERRGPGCKRTWCALVFGAALHIPESAQFLTRKMAEPRPPVGRSSMKSILVIDDSPTMRRMVRACLRDIKDVTFVEAASGLEAIEHLALVSASLIILDLNMPDMHGLDVLRFIRSHAAYQAIPVIVLTTRGDEASRSAALDAGASAYLTKPFAPQVLAASVGEFVTNL